MSIGKVLIIPIDVKSRELYGKTLLACFGAVNGYNVILGQKGQIDKYINDLPRGVYIDKTVLPKRGKRFNKLKEVGYIVAAYDEEGLVFQNKKVYNNRFSKESIMSTDFFFTWGDMQKSIILETVPMAESKIYTVGNPRFDIINNNYLNLYSEEVNKIRKKYGKYILINSNFGTFNHHSGFENLMEKYMQIGKIKTEFDEKIYRERYKFHSKLYKFYIEAILRLSESTEYNIVLRPHPSENIETWKNDIKNSNNVHIIREGSSLPWIIGADYIIHNGCTTGIEAYLFNKNVIAFRPVISEEGHDFYLPNNVSYEVFSIDELVECISNSDDISKHDEKKDKILEEHLTSYNGEMACTKIISILNDLEHLNDNNRGICIKKFKYLYDNIYFYMRGIKKSKSYLYEKQIFPGLRIEELSNLVMKLEENNAEFKAIKIKKIARNIFMFNS